MKKVALHITEINSLRLASFAGLNYEGFRHTLSQRNGGNSTGDFASCNLGLHVGDRDETVIANRQQLCTALDWDFARLVTAEQVHGCSIAVVTASDAGRGARKYDEAIKQTDSLVSGETNLPLMLCYADCVPVFIADCRQRIVAVVHAGWRGSLQNIVGKTIEKMQRVFGSNAKDCRAAIGPAICENCYEVSSELTASFVDAGWRLAVVRRKDRWFLNLPLINYMQLQNQGLLTENIEVADVCTAENSELWFSHRASGGRAGRLAAIISA